LALARGQGPNKLSKFFEEKFLKKKIFRRKIFSGKKIFLQKNFAKIFARKFSEIF